jgi:hypothetical protein
MKNLLLAALALVLVSVASQPVYAGGGGGGAKRNSTIRVANNSALQVAVILDNLTPPTSSTSAFLNAGGKILFPGQVGTFKVSGGAHTVVARPLTSTSPSVTFGNQASVPVSVAKGGARTVSITNTDRLNVILSPL